MTKRALFVVAGFLSLSLPLFAQETQHREEIQPVFTLGRLSQRSSAATRFALGRTEIFRALNSSYYGFPWLTLADGRLFSLMSAFTEMEATPPDFLPEVSADEPLPRIHRVATSAPERDSGDKVMEVKPKLFDYAGGEVGGLYGRSTGKFGGELEQGYIFGEVGNDKVHISVGASYEEFNGRFPRRRR